MQRGQAPCGELNEKMRGWSSGSETPWSGHAKFCEKSISVPSITSMTTRPSPRPAAVSIDCVSRSRRSAFMTRRSTTTSIECLNFLSSSGTPSSSTTSMPSTFARVKPSRDQLLEDVLVLALAVAHERRVDREPRALVEPQHLVDDRVDRLARDRLAADRAVRAPDSRVEQAEVVVDLGDRADRRARVARGRLLVDRDRRAEAVDVVDVRLLHHLEELARVGGERLDVTSLPLGVDRVEGKARLPGAREPGDADQAMPRQPDGDVLQVVLAGAVDDQFVGSHSWSHSTVRTCVREGGSAQPKSIGGSAVVAGMRFRNNAGLDPSQVERPARPRGGLPAESPSAAAVSASSDSSIYLLI